MKFERIPKPGEFERVPKGKDFIGPLEPTYKQSTKVPEEKRFYALQDALTNTDPDFVGDAMEQGITLMQKYPDIQEYSLFHLLNSSTPPEGTSKTDLPGEDSILAFMEEHAKKQNIHVE
jgi:hypothetical protein